MVRRITVSDEALAKLTLPQKRLIWDAVAYCHTTGKSLAVVEETPKDMQKNYSMYRRPNFQVIVTIHGTSLEALEEVLRNG